MNSVNRYVRLVRPQQWIKNLFIFAPLIFSRHLFEVLYLISAIRGFIVFCLVSSTVYIINDIFDREADKLHPLKRLRPLASGEISILVASILAVLFLALAGLLSSGLSIHFQIVCLGYLSLQILYSWKLKQIVLLDVFIIAAGFMLRVIAGAEVIDVIVSTWIIVCTMFLSLFLATAKRRGELVLMSDVPGFGNRKVLALYDLKLLDMMLMITGTGMAISYALYTVAERTVSAFGTEHLIFTTIFVLFGLFRYLFLVYRENKGENPVSIILSDMAMFINLCCWFASCVLIIYF